MFIRSARYTTHEARGLSTCIPHPCLIINIHFYSSVLSLSSLSSSSSFFHFPHFSTSHKRPKIREQIGEIWDMDKYPFSETSVLWRGEEYNSPKDASNNRI